MKQYIKQTLSMIGLIAFCGLNSANSAQAQISLETLEMINTKILGQESRLASLKYVDIRDLLTYGTELQGTSKKLMEAMTASPGRFIGPVNGAGGIDEIQTQVSFTTEGPLGPNGATSLNSKGKKYFDYSVATDNSGTRLDTILSAHFEEIVEEKIDKVFKLKLLLFVHDSRNPLAATSNGYYFRRVWVRVDWTANKANLYDIVKVLDFVEDIPLSRTKFKLVGDLLERKVILQDSLNNITKVFPIGVGGFDIRTAMGDGGEIRLQTDEFPVATLKSVRLTGELPYNTRSRVIDHYFKGRPFLAIFLNGKQYIEIGMHYQIDSYGLQRGFVSHGCIRVRDMDLYQLDIILNEGPDDEIEAQLLYDLKGYDQYVHPMPKVDTGYKARLYSTLPTTLRVDCSILKKTHRDLGFLTPSRFEYVGDNGEQYYSGIHEVVDEDCLAQNTWIESSAQEVMDYIEGKSNIVPRTPISSTAEHYPVTEALKQQQITVNDDGYFYDFNNNQGGGNYNEREGMSLYDLLRQGGYSEEPAVRRTVGTQEEINFAHKNIKGWEAVFSRVCNVRAYDESKCSQAHSQLAAWKAELNRLMSY